MSKLVSKVKHWDFWSAVSKLVDEKEWRRRRREVFGTTVMVATVDASQHCDLLASGLHRRGWECSTSDVDSGGKFIARRRWVIGGRSSAEERRKFLRDELVEEIVSAGLPAETGYELRLANPGDVQAGYVPDWSLPEWMFGRAYEVSRKIRRDQALQWRGYVLSRPVELGDSPLPSGVPLVRDFSTAELLRGAVGAPVASVKRARALFVVTCLSVLVVALVSLPGDLREWAADWPSRVVTHVGPRAFASLGAGVVAVFGLVWTQRHRHPAWIKCVSVVSLVVGAGALLSLAANQGRKSFPTSTDFALAMAALMPLVGAAGVMVRIRAKAWRAAAKAVALAAVSAVSVGWIATLMGQAYASGLDIVGWSARLPFFGLLEALGAAVAYVVTFTIVMGAGSALVAGSSRLLGACLALVTSGFALATALVLVLSPYNAGAHLRQGHVQSGWEHLADRACVLADKPVYGVDTGKPYWVVPGDDDRVALISVSPSGEPGVLLVPRNTVAMRIVGASATCRHDKSSVASRVAS